MMCRLHCALLLAAMSLPALSAERETLGPSSRRSPIIISEVMYHPLDSGDGQNLEFVELYNSGLQPVSLAGWRLSGDISYTFPAGPVLQPGSFLVVAASPAAFTNRIANVLGPFTNALPNQGGTLRLRNAAGAVLWEVDYDDTPPWPMTADGGGHSLVLARPSFGERDPRAWAASAVRGGSPGGPEPAYAASTFEDLVINEVGTTTNRFGDSPYIEMFNRSGTGLAFNATSPIFLTDDPATNKVRLGAAGLSGVAARTATALPLSALGLLPKPGGGTFYLIDTAQNRVLDMVRYSDQSTNFALGRIPDGADHWATVTPTPLFAGPAPDPGQRPPFRSDIIINEIMYHPVSGRDEDEYVEVYNRNGQSAVNVSGWKFVAGIELTLPPNTSIPPNGFLVVAKNAAHLRTNYAGLDNVVGDYSGQLSDRGERLALARPEHTSAFAASHLGSDIVYVVMDEVTYGTGGTWGHWSDGGGASLELASPEGDNDWGPHWRDSAEPSSTPWTTLRASGPLEFGETRSIPNAVEFLLLGEGECLVDNVEVIVAGVNRVTNGTLDSGTNGWVFNGTHDTSGWRASGGVNNSGCLHLRATAHGDTYANRVFVPLTITLTPGQPVTIGAQVRHLRGNRDVLMRLRGNWLDAGVSMTVAPGSYGSPGRANAAAASPPAPAIYDVHHQPVLPAANQSVVVTARFDGARTNTSFIKELLYRVDPNASYVTLAMNDNGANGDAVANDGVSSATIPGQPAGQLVAFRVVARYTSPAATSSFPNPQPLYSGDLFGRECLVRFGDPRPNGSFANYRIWMTQATHNRWATRGSEHHSPLNTTFVYADQRAFYNVDSGYAGQEFIYDTPTGIICGYNLGFAPDERLLGAREMLLDWGQSDDAGQRENVAFWIAEQMGLPFLYRRHVILAVNGVLPTQRPLTGYHPLSAKIYWDAQEPNGDFTQQWFPEDDKDGQLYKLHHIVFGSDPANIYGAHLFRFIHFIDSAGQRHQSGYRWHWRRRGADQGASDLRTAFRLLDAVNAPDSAYVPNVEALVDVNQWMRTFAFERVIGNVDSLGWDNGHNMYGYYSPRRGWNLLAYDCELSLATPTGSWYDTSPTKDLFSYTYDDGEFKGDQTLGRMKQNPAFQRAYWRAFRDAINGPLVTANFLPLMQRYQSALIANGITVASPSAMQTYLETRREYIRGRLATVNANFAVSSPLSGTILNNNLVSMTGSAPIEVATIAVNGTPQCVTWTSVTTWSLRLALTPGSQTLVVQALDARTQAIAGLSTTLNLQLNAPSAAPDTNIVINEIMYHSVAPGGEFLELHNRSATTAFDLSGWRINGLDFTFPTNSIIAPDGFIVVAADRLTFGQLYGFNLPVAGVFEGSFDQGGETLTLRRPTGTNEMTVDTVTYDDDFPWPLQADGGGPSLQLISPGLDNNRVANWTALTNAITVGVTNLFTPGAANQVAAPISPLPQIWLNELQVINVTGPRDGTGQPDPWVELYNASGSIDLTGYFLSNDRTNLTRWQFPAGSTMAAGEFKLVWLDGDTVEQASTEWHAGFRLESSDKMLVLSRVTGGRMEIVDYLTFDQLLPDQSVARVPDGASEWPRLLDYATPAASNSNAPPLPAISINEILAANTIWADPADGDTEDFFELHNASDRSVSLAGYTLTDRIGIPRKFVIPESISIGPRGFLLVWADEEEGQTQTNGDLHVNFRLNDGGEVVALYAPDGRLVDGFTFGTQIPNTSLARWPDGTGGYVATTNATPGLRNRLNGFVRRPLAVEAEILSSGAVKIYFTAGYGAAVLCTGGLSEKMQWTEVSGLRGYDPLTDREWILDRTTAAGGTQQRFYKAVSAR